MARPPTVAPPERARSLLRSTTPNPDQSDSCKTATFGAQSHQRVTAPAQNPAPILATLTGDDTCEALGIAVTAPAPVLAICRRLVEAGHHPATPLEARGDVLSLRVRSIGEAARLRVSPKGVGFVPLDAVPAASPLGSIEDRAP